MKLIFQHDYFYSSMNVGSFLQCCTVYLASLLQMNVSMLSTVMSWTRSCTASSLNFICLGHFHYCFPVVDQLDGANMDVPLQLSVVLIFNWLKMLKSTWAADGHCGDSCFDMPFCMVQVETWQEAPLTVSFCSCLLLLSSTSLTSFPVPPSHSCSAAPKHFRYRKCPSGRNCMPSWASFSCL